MILAISPPGLHWLSTTLICVTNSPIMTHMIKTQIYLPEDDLKALRETARRSGRSMADLVREAVRQVWLGPDPVSTGPVALWDGRPSCTSIEHDAIYDEP